MPWAQIVETALRLGWTPADLWAATLFEFETAVSCALPESSSKPSMTDDDLRSFLNSRAADA